MKKAFSKIHLNSDYMRKAYYELSDKTAQMREANKKLQDEEVSAEIKKIEDSLNQIHLLLENKYIWD
jgi:hypothetical protein